MQISHIHKTFGSMEQFQNIPGSAEIIVHSGDMFPVLPYGDSKLQEEHQKQWLYSNLEDLYDLIGYRDFLFCAGASDYYDPCPRLQSYGLSAINITDRIVRMGDFNFFGLKETVNLISKLNSCVTDKINILVSNCSSENRNLLTEWLSGNEQFPELILSPEELYCDNKSVITVQAHNFTIQKTYNHQTTNI